MDCEALFSSDFLDLPSTIPPRRWKNISEGEVILFKKIYNFQNFFSSDLQDLYSHGNQVNIISWFFNNAKDGGGRREAKVFTEKKINEKGELAGHSGWRFVTN